MSVAGVSPRRGFLVGFVFGLGFMLVLLPWLQVVSPLAWPALAALEAVLLGLLGTAWALLGRLPWSPVWQAAAWVLLESLRGAVPFGGFPWGRVAYAAADTPAAGLARLLGHAGLAFVVVLLACLVAQAMTTSRARRRATSLGLAALVAVGVVAVPGPGATPPGGGETVRVAVVQGNTPGTGLEAMAERRAVLDNHVDATRRLARQVDAGTVRRPDLVVWPENSSDLDPYADPSVRAEIASAVHAVGVPTLMGAVVDGPHDSGWYNRAIVWGADGTIGAHYDKRHAVPFGEYIPLRSVLAPLVPALDQIPQDLITGTRPGLLQVGPARTGVLMCFEVGYEGQVRGLASDGAQVIVVPTNNATYMGTGQVEQQFAISRMVAVETGRFVVVAATNGISGVIAPDGSVVARAPVRTSRVLVVPVTLGSGLTPGVRFGGAVEGGLWVLAMVALGAAWWLTYRRPAGAAHDGPGTLPSAETQHVRSPDA